MYCKKCGAQIPDNSKTCPNCGAPVNSFSFEAPVSKETGDIIIQAVTAILGVWLVYLSFKPFTYSIQSLFAGIQYIFFGFRIRGILELLLSLFNVLRQLIYLGLGAFCFYMAAVWKREKMDGLLGLYLILAVAEFALTAIQYVFGLILYGGYYMGPIGGIIKYPLPAMIAFVTLYLLISFLCPVTPFAKVKDKESLSESLNDVMEVLPESIPAMNQQKAEPKEEPKAEPKTPKPAEPAVQQTKTAASGAPVILKTNRGWFKYLVFSFFTCDIYALYEIHRISKEMNLCCEGDGQKTPGILKLLFFTIITCGFYAFYYHYALARRIQQTAHRKYGILIGEGGGSVLFWITIGNLLCFIGTFVALHIIFKNMNILFTAYNTEQMAELISDGQGGN